MSAPLWRFGVQWNGPHSPVCVGMSDGYWTPWHIAQDQINDLETASKELAEALKAIVGDPGVRRVRLELHEQGLAALAKYEARQ